MHADGVSREPPSPVLVTGAAGFVASHVVAQLAQAGARVIAVDVEDTPPSTAALWADHTARIREVSCDVRDRAAVESLMAAFDPPAVVHAAAITNAAGPAESARMYEVNVLGSDIVISSAREARLVFVSSASVYQARSDDLAVYAEDAPVVEPACGQDESTTYAATKRAGEVRAVTERVHGSDFRVARVATCFGPTERPTSGRTIMSTGHQVVDAARTGARPIAPRDATIDLTYVADVARGVVNILSASTTSVITNVSAGHAVRLTDLTDTVWKERSRRRGSDHWDRTRDISLPPGARHGVLDTGRLANLGFVPHYTLEHAVSAYLDWLDCHEH